MNNVESRLLINALAHGGEWRPNGDGKIEREVVRDQALFRRCCGRRMWKVYRDTMNEQGMTAPVGSKLRAVDSDLIRFECECGYQEKAYVGGW